MAAFTICSDFGAPQNKVSHCFHCFPSYLPWSDGTSILKKQSHYFANKGPSRRSNQSILKEISPGCSLEGLMLKLKLQYFGHLMRRVDSLEKTVMLGAIGGRRRRGGQRMRWLDGMTDSMDMSLNELRVGDRQGGLVCCDSRGHRESDTTERLNWTDKYQMDEL